jgi:hypothetical protein
MADNVGYTPGSGALVAADDVDGVLYQRVKLSSGVNGVAVDVSEDAPLPVSDEQLTFLLTRMLNVLNAPQGYDKSLQRQRGTVLVESGTVTTVTNMTNLTGTIGAYQATQQVWGTNMSAWAAVVRSRIT